MDIPVLDYFATPASSKKPNIHTELERLFRLATLRGVMPFKSAADRTTQFANMALLGLGAPTIGALSHREDAGVYERYNGSAAPTVASAWTPVNLPNTSVLSGPTGTGSTNGLNTYTDLPGGSMPAFTKISAASALTIDVTLLHNLTVAINTQVQVGVQIDGVDFDVYTSYMQVTGDYRTTAGFNKIGAGLVTAGLKAPKLRWRRAAGTGTFNVDGNNTVTAKLTEVS